MNARSLAITAMLCAPLAAQSFAYQDFTSTSGLTLLGHAASSNGKVRLTNATISQASWLWHQTPVSVTTGFDTTFTFVIAPIPDTTWTADGLAFVIHDDPNGALATGANSMGIGYGSYVFSPGIRNSIAIELDTYANYQLFDGSDNELSVHTMGAAPNDPSETATIGRVSPGIDFTDGRPHTMRVRYVPGTLDVFLDDLVTPLLSIPYDFVNGGTYENGSPAPGANLQNGTAYVGFTATATGFLLPTQTTDIFSWHWSSGAPPDGCFDGTLGTDTVRVQGSPGDLYRRVRLGTSQPFDIEIANPPAFAGAPYVLVGSLQPQPGAPGTALGFGSTCFPVAPLGSTEVVLVDAVGLFGGLLPAQPTPHVISIPTGAVPFPLDLTMQAVTIADSSTLALGITNAVTAAIATTVPPRIHTVRPWSTAVGQPIAIEGFGFVPGLTVTINGNQVTPTSVTPTEIVFPYPSGVGCNSQVTVTHPDGLSVSHPFNPQPTFASQYPLVGGSGGGTLFTVYGTGFAPGTTMTIGGTPATPYFGLGTPTSISVTTPPGQVGTAQVVITTPGGCTLTTTFQYL